VTEAAPSPSVAPIVAESARVVVEAPIVPPATPVPPKPRPVPKAVESSPSPAAPQERKVPPSQRTPRPNDAEAAVPGEAPGEDPSKPAGRVRLWISAGEENGVTPESLRDFILGTTGEPAASLGGVDLRARHAFVEVPGDRAASFVSRLKRAEFAGRRLKAKIA
jgi:hypothetical protein